MLQNVAVESFRGSNFIRDLNLGSNLIDHVGVNSFSSMYNLSYLDLSSNLLASLNVQTFNNMPRLPFEINLQNNRMNESVKNDIREYFKVQHNISYIGRNKNKLVGYSKVNYFHKYNKNNHLSKPVKDESCSKVVFVDNDRESSRRGYNTVYL